MSYLKSIACLIAVVFCGCIASHNTSSLDVMADNFDLGMEHRTTEEFNSDNPILITQHSQLHKHVGKIVTLRGVQSETKIPAVLGVGVDGDYETDGKIVEVTGMLGTYETTQEYVDAFEESMKHTFEAMPWPVAGTHFSICIPGTYKQPKPKLVQDNRIQSQNRNAR